MTPSERRYIAGRLQADGIAVAIDELWTEFDLPIVITDSEILAVYEAADKRASDMLAEHSRPLINMPVGVPPDGWDRPTMHAAPTWRRANRGEIWMWIGVGAGGAFISVIAGLLGYAAVVS